MIQIFAVLFLAFQYGSTEPPVNGYLPSSRSSHISKNYAPPAANVSFNFGFSPRASKSEMFRDSASGQSVQESPEIKSHSPFYERKEVLEKSDINSSNNFRAHASYPTSGQQYQTPHTGMNHLPRTSYETYSSYDSHTTKLPYVKYGTPSEDSLPVIEENFVQRKSQDLQRSHHAIQSDVNNFGYDSSRSSNGHSESNGKSENYPYDFSYEVMAPETGVSLGHHESHDGSAAEGVYHNLLPDGRLLTVEYWADDGGFKPRLSYKTLHSSKSDNLGPY